MDDVERERLREMNMEALEEARFFGPSPMGPNPRMDGLRANSKAYFNAML